MKSQRGGFVIGFIVGLLIGLALALGVALYVAKVPLPFINKVAAHSAQEDAEQAAKNKNWDPNASLYGKNPAVPHAVAASEPASAASGAAPDAGAQASSAPAATASAPASAVDAGKVTRGEREARALLEGGVGAASTAASGEASLSYYVQAGAFSTNDEADSQRAKLALMGLEAKVSQREQSGRTVYRVRVGPFDDRQAAEDLKSRLASEAIDASIVRVPH